jgi:hypothetical protein
VGLSGVQGAQGREGVGLLPQLQHLQLLLRKIVDLCGDIMKRHEQDSPEKRADGVYISVPEMRTPDAWNRLGLYIEYRK